MSAFGAESSANPGARQHLLGAILTVTLSLCVVFQMRGVQLYDLVRYVTYVLVVVVGPGVALMRWATGEKCSLLRLICVGAGLGYALEAYVFMALSALDLRAIWVWYPAIGMVSLLWLLVLSRKAGCLTCPALLDAPVALWIKAVSIGVIVMIYMTFNAYLSVFSYGAIVAPDLLLHLGTAAEIKHHWPVTDPRLAGASLSYHYLTHVHIAAASLITGVDLQEILFRLYLLPLLLLVTLNTFLLSRVFTRRPSIQLLALLMVFFPGIISLAPFLETNFSVLFAGGAPQPLADPWLFASDALFSGSSPSLVYGYAMFLPLVFSTLRIINKGYFWRKDTIFIVLLMAGSMLAKGSFMPVYITGLVLAAIWLRLQGKKEWFNAVKIVGLSLGVCLPLYFLFLHQYWQGGSSQPALVPFAMVRETDLWTRFEPVLRSLWGAGASKNAIDWGYRGIAVTFGSMILAMYFVVSYGTRLFGIGFHFCRHGWRMPAKIVVLTCLVIGGLLPAYLLSLVDSNQMHFFNSVDPVFSIVGALGLGHLIFNTNFKPSRLIWQALAIFTLVVSTWYSIYSLWIVHKKNIDAGTLVRSVEFLDSSGVYEAQRWIESHTPTNAVLAVNLFADDKPGLVRRSDYSAFAERRLFLEGAHYQRGRDPGELAARRMLLVDVFRNGSEASLNLLREQYKVTHLVVDNSNGVSMNLPGKELTLLFQNSSVKVYEILSASGS